MSLIVKSPTSLFPNGIFCSLTGVFFSVFSKASLCRDITSFQQSVFWCWGDALLLVFCWGFFLMRGVDGLYQWTPRNDDVLITSVLTREGVLSAARVPSCVCEACNVAAPPADGGVWEWAPKYLGKLRYSCWRDFRIVLLELCSRDAAGPCCVQMSSPIPELCCWG